MNERNGNILMFVALAGAAYFLLKKKVATMKQYVTGLRVRITNVKYKTGTITMDFNIDNPSNAPVIVKALVGDVLINGTKVGAVTLYGDHVIQPVSNSKVPISIRVIKMAALAEIINLIMGKSKGKMLVRFDGIINANNQALPLHIGIQI